MTPKLLLYQNEELLIQFNRKIKKFYKFVQTVCRCIMYLDNYYIKYHKMQSTTDMCHEQYHQIVIKPLKLLIFYQIKNNSDITELKESFKFLSYDFHFFIEFPLFLLVQKVAIMKGLPLEPIIEFLI